MNVQKKANPFTILQSLRGTLESIEESMNYSKVVNRKKLYKNVNY